MTFSVTHWEKVQGEDIPICQPNRCTYSCDDDSVDDVNSRYISISLKDLGAHKDARKCRKLLKQGYRLMVTDVITNSRESELRNFLYYVVVLSSRTEPVTKQSFYFKRNQDLCHISDSCYASDDNGIALLKMVSRKLRCCFIDLKSFRFQQLNIHFVPTVCLAKVFKKSVWLILVNATILNVYQLRFSKECFSSWIQLEYEEFTPHKILENLTVSDKVFMLDKFNLYIAFDGETQKLVTKEIPVEIFAKITSNKVVGDLCLMTSKDNKDHQAKIFLARIFPQFELIKVVDIFSSIPNCAQYIPAGFELVTFPSCMKALVVSGESFVIVIDLKKLAVSQILSYIDCFWQHKLKLQFSRNGKNVRFLGHYRSISDASTTKYLTLKFNVWHGMSLKSFCFQTLIKHFSLDKLRKFELPKNLFKELMLNSF